MTNMQAGIVGLSIVAGFGLLGIIGQVGAPTATASSDADVLRQLESLRHRHELELVSEQADAAETQALLERGRPEVLRLGDQDILVESNFEQKGGSFQLKKSYFVLQDGRLVELGRAD